MKLLLAVARFVLFLVARGGACIPPLDRKYKIRERLGGPWVKVNCNLKNPDARPRRLWLHGASLGECKMLLSLARTLKKDWPSCPEILLTTQKAEAVAPLEKIADGLCEISIAPADLPFTLQKFIDRVNPAVLVLGENELWPGYVACMKRAGRKTALVSGRILRDPVGVDLSSLDFVAHQKDCGNWKLLEWARETPQANSSESPGAIAGRLVSSNPVDVAFISFHKEELASFCALASSAIAARKSVVLAPRRLEEVSLFCGALQARGFQTVTWPQVQKSAVSIVNRFGCISEILQDCRIAVIGGSFVKNPGVHDFWEPLRAGVQTFVGPYTKGAEEAASELLASGALLQIQDPVPTMADSRRIADFLNVPANGPAIKSALQTQRQKILNSYERLLKFLSVNL
ncbi:MAG: 3-deoxy-D-manno-octulosonic acid transferase [Fibrobacter sp.]|nr:3-deoxy-D-manno-octulosonic acid transferase [Fibrobacter sp.]